MSLRKYHAFVPNLRAIQQNFSHSTHRNSSHRSIHHRCNHHSRKCPWYMSVQLSSDFEFSRPERPAFDVSPLCTPLAPWFALLVPLDFPLDFPVLSLLLPVRAHSGTMTCSVCLCHTIACLCLCVHCNLVENVHHRTSNTHRADLMTLFLFSTASTSMGSEFPSELVSLGLESRIFRPNFASTFVTTSRRALSNVRRRFELRIRCFSSSSRNKDSRTASLMSSSNQPSSSSRGETRRTPSVRYPLKVREESIVQEK